MNRIKAIWLKIPEKWQLEIKSAWHTFLSAFIVSVLIELGAHQNESITMNLAIGIGSAAVRGGVKAGGIALWNWVTTQIEVWKATRNQ